MDGIPQSHPFPFVDKYTRGITMPLPVENTSAQLIDFLKDRFEIADSVNDKGAFTDDPTEIKVFSFNYINKKGEDKGSVVISLLDDSESRSEERRVGKE